MLIYLLFIGVIIIEWLIMFPEMEISYNGLRSYNHKKNFLILVCIEMIVLAGIRATNIGADTEVYIRALNYYKSLPKESILQAKLVYPFDFEIGYFLLTKISAWLSLDENIFLFAIACMIYIPIFRFIFNYSENPLLSVLAYMAFGYFEYSLGIFRQMISLSIVIMGVKYIEQRNVRKYILIVLLASMFHTTAIITFPLYWIKNINLKNKLKWVFMVEIILFFIGRWTILLITKIFPKYASYIGGKYDIQGGSYIMLIFLNVILIIAYYVIVADNKNIFLSLSVNALAVATWIQILGYYMGIFGRIVPYYSIYLIILIPSITDRIFKKNIFLAHAIVTIGLIIIFYVLSNNSYIVPYQVMQ